VATVRLAATIGLHKRSCLTIEGSSLLKKTFLMPKGGLTAVLPRPMFALKASFTGLGDLFQFYSIVPRTA